MKLFIISDIHGSALAFNKAVEAFNREQASLMVICGDYLNHGPRNPLPEGHDTKALAAALNSMKAKICGVRGNCDSEVDQMMLTFPCLASYTTLAIPASKKIRRLFIHHGHLYSREELSSWLPKGTIVISGHTHVTVMEEEAGLFYFNPGSISLPKCDDGNTCGILEIENDRVKVGLYTIEGKLLREREF